MMCANKWLILNCDCYIATLETILLCAKRKKMSTGSFKNVIYKNVFANHIFNIYTYKQDLAWNKPIMVDMT